MLNYRKQWQLNWQFLKQSPFYLRDVLVAHLFLLFIVIPGLTSLTKFILTLGNITYLPLEQLPHFIWKHPLVTIHLLAIGLLLFLFVFFEFTFLLASMYFMLKKQWVSLFTLLHFTITQLKQLRGGVLSFFIFYFLLLLPFNTFSFRSDLLANIQIPAFIMDYIFTNRWSLIIVFGIVYLFFLYLGFRLIFVLPELIFNQCTVKQAIHISWNLTKQQFISLFIRFSIILLTITLITSASFFIILTLQSLIDRYLPHYALLAAIFSMFLLQFLLLLSLTLTTISSFYYTLTLMNEQQRLPEKLLNFPILKPAFQFRLSFPVLILLGLVFIGATGFYNYHYLQTDQKLVTQTISHRGVSNQNGVQNTLASLQKTSTIYHPDYIEIDVQETSDHHFIVFHDFSYKALAGVSLKPERSTLDTALRLTVHENGYTEKISTLDTYLKTAAQTNQKLLIELKTQQTDVHGFVQRFLSRYQTQIEQQHHMIQSLNLQVSEQVKSAAPTIQTGYIIPFNLVGPPKTTTDFLATEMTTITKKFVRLAHQNQQKVYVWTPNDQTTMERMLFYGVDGIITDRMDYLNQVTTQTPTQSYADKLAFFVIGLG